MQCVTHENSEWQKALVFHWSQSSVAAAFDNRGQCLWCCTFWGRTLITLILNYVSRKTWEPKIAYLVTSEFLVENIYKSTT